MVVVVWVSVTATILSIAFPVAMAGVGMVAAMVGFVLFLILLAATMLD